LIGGGLLVYRMDYDGSTHSRAVAVLQGLSTTPMTPAGWLQARPDSRVQIARGGRAYAVFPLGAKGVTCSQRVEIVTPDGTSCGSREYALAQGSCDTQDLTVGAGGTVIQQLPSAM